MVNLSYLRYFLNAAESGSLVRASSLSHVSSSAISQAIKWLEDFYQVSLIEHGKNKFVLTQKGMLVAKEAKNILRSADEFQTAIYKIAKPESDFIKLSMQQSIANSVVDKAINNFSKKSPFVELAVRIGTSHRCREMLASGEIPYSISIDNVNFDAHYKNLYSGRFIFISSKDDTRSPQEAGFILTEDTAEVLALKKNYFKKFKTKIPIKFAISSWGVITNMALGGNGIAYVPDYYLRELDKSRYRIRKIDVETTSYNVNFYYSKHVEFSKTHQALFEEVKKQFNLKI